MTEDRLPLAELLQKAGDGDFLRSVAEAVLQLLMESDVEGLIGAGRHERSAERLNWRNGYRDRTLDARLGTLQLRVPKLRQGSYFPAFLEPRKTSEKALVAVIQGRERRSRRDRWRVDPARGRARPGHGPRGHQQEHGLQAVQGHRRRGPQPARWLGWDERVNAFLERPLDGTWPYLWLDATYLKVREGAAAGSSRWPP
jgi:putative transposase